jgi:uncharacterized protein (TIGR00369 family)
LADDPRRRTVHFSAARQQAHVLLPDHATGAPVEKPDFSTGTPGMTRLECGCQMTQNPPMQPTPRQRFTTLATLEDGAFSALLGLKVTAASEGRVSVRMPFHLRLLNNGPPDVPIHGGAIASLADFAACAAVWTMPRTERSATISMSINYLAPGVQSDLVANAVVRRYGKRVASLTVEILDRHGNLVADALITYKVA